MLKATLFTKLRRDAWKQATQHLSFEKKQQYFEQHMVSSMTFLQECMHRYTTLSSVRDAARILPDWFMNYNIFSNLNNTVHYFSKYHDNLDHIEQKLLRQGYSEIDIADDEEIKKLSNIEPIKSDSGGASIFNTASSLLALKTQQHKHPLSDEELDDYALRALLPPSDPPEQAQMKGLAKRFRTMVTEDPTSPISPQQREQFKSTTATEILITMRGYPDFLERRSVELLFPTEEISISLQDGNNVSQEFKDRVRMLTDPTYLPSRNHLYPLHSYKNHTLISFTSIDTMYGLG